MRPQRRKGATEKGERNSERREGKREKIERERKSGMTNQERRIEIGEHGHNAREHRRETDKEGERKRERTRETDREALLSHHISRVYGVRGKEGQQTCRAESDGRTREQGTGSEGSAEEEDEAGRELRGDSWFTCRHGNAASPLTCYSIGIARPSAAVLSQPPQKYEHESRSIAWDRERADASFPMGERSVAGGAISASPREDRRILLSFFPTGTGGKREEVSRRVRHGHPFSRSTTTYAL